MKYPDGAYYLAGYAVECALKACIAKATVRHDFPAKKKVDDSHTHSLEKLIKVAKLEEAWSERVRIDSRFRTSWEIVQSWSELSRYKKHDLETAKEFIAAVNDRAYGVMAWIKQHW